MTNTEPTPDTSPEAVEAMIEALGSRSPFDREAAAMLRAVASERNALKALGPDWFAWEADLKRAAVHDASPLDDEALDRFRHALADVHCKSSSAQRHEVEYRLQRFGAKLWRRILARLDAAEAEAAALREALRGIDGLAVMEINPSNYDHDDVCELSHNASYAAAIVAAALAANREW